MNKIRCNKCNQIFDIDKINPNMLDDILQEHYNGHIFDEMLKTNYTILSDNNVERTS